MSKHRKKTKFTILVSEAEIKIRKAAVRPVLKLRDKTKYSRQENKRFPEQLPDRCGRGVFLLRLASALSGGNRAGTTAPGPKKHPCGQPEVRPWG